MRFASPTVRLTFALLIAIVLHAALLLGWHFAPSDTQRQTPLQLMIQHPPTAAKHLPSTIQPSKSPSATAHTNHASAPAATVKVAPSLEAETTAQPGVSGKTESPPDNRTTTLSSNATSPPPTSTSSTGTNATPGATSKPTYSQHASIRQRVEPAYPEEARKQNKEGMTKVKVHLSKEGTITQSAILLSSGTPILDNALLEAISHWRFSPAIDQNGQAVEETLVIPYRFQLRKDNNDE